jgi:hypothetical protein
MSSITDIPRYPAGHPEAGKIIVKAEDLILATMDLMAKPPDPDVERLYAAPGSSVMPPPGSRFSRSGAGEREAVPPAPAAEPTGRFAEPIAPGARKPLVDKPAERQAKVNQRLVVAAGALALLAVLMTVSVIGSRSAVPAAPAGPTAVPTMPATPAATSGPTLTAMPPNTAPRALVGYFDYGDPTTATPIERGTTYTPVGRAGQRWLLVELDGGGRVWAVAEDLGATVDPALPDLAARAPASAAPAPPAAPMRPGASAPAVPAVPSCAWVEVRRDVYDDTGTPIGFVVSGGCGQAEAEANAQAEAEKMRARRSAP